MRTLVVFPHAGGSSLFYRTIFKNVTEASIVYLDYPGHLMKLEEPLAKTMEELVAYLIEELMLEGETEFIFFGHSMGGSVAYEVMKKMHLTTRYNVTKLIISAKLPCGEMNRNSQIETVEDMWQYIESLHHDVSEVSKQQEFSELLLPIMKQDINLLTFYEQKKKKDNVKALDVQPFIFIGKKDRGSFIEYKKWQKAFQQSCTYTFFEGGHFYLEKTPQIFLEKINQIILL